MGAHINDLDAKRFMRKERAYRGVLVHLRLPKHNTYLVLYQTKLVSLTIESPLLDNLDAARFGKTSIDHFTFQWALLFAYSYDNL